MLSVTQVILDVSAHKLASTHKVSGNRFSGKQMEKNATSRHYVLLVP
jgi:hypothetical protein